jgi:hypothetical protein
MSTVANIVEGGACGSAGGGSPGSVRPDVQAASTSAPVTSNATAPPARLLLVPVDIPAPHRDE